jgi:uncharacterized protein (DUF427 family)
MKSTYNNVVVAGSNDTVMHKNNHYFKKDCVMAEILQHSHVPFPKEFEPYYTLKVIGSQSRDINRDHLCPKTAGANIAGHMAFCKCIKIAEYDETI